MRFFPIFFATILASISAFAAEPDLSGVDEKQIMIPMRDGVKLSAWVYFPKDSATPLPAVFEQRYASLRANRTRESAARLARAGYVVALVNYRGTHDSEGKWVGYRAMQWGELQDGYDVCEWLAAQSWCDGKVGTFGSSQGGYAQNYLAVTQPPHLVCQYMIDTGLSLFHEGYRLGGTTRPGRFSAFGGAKNPQDNLDLLAEWYRHPHYDDYWKAEDASLHFDKMNVPCFTIGSWFDFMNQGSIASFVGRQHQGGENSRGNQWLAIGPWLHGRTNKGHKVGELNFPERAAWPVEDHMIRWFDYWLKGKPEAADVVAAPPVRYFAMGAAEEPGAPGNVWRDLQNWPPKAEETPYFLKADGGLSKTKPASGGATSFKSDPRNPMEIPGRAFPGARDARKFEEQSDVITFTTAPLEKPVEWTGRIFAKLFVKSTAPDTDIIVRISDVYPDGRSILLVDYPWRMRYRDGFESEKLMTPGEVHEVKFPVGWISQIFAKGHRIRVTISSTGAPLYEPNPQNGKPLTIEFPDDAQVATNTIMHSDKWPSQIIAPTGVVTKRPEYVLDEQSRKIVPDEKLIYKKIDDRELEMHVFKPKGHDPKTDKRPAFLFIHGGGWAGGEPLRFYSFARHFADKGMVSFSMQYRLWDRSGKGKNTVFDCVKDGRSAVRYLRENASELGIDPDKIAISGGSAGGHVAVGTALFDEVNESTDNLEISCRPDLMVLLNPVIDTSEIGFGQNRIGERWQELSPVHHVKSGLPPAIIFFATGDQVVPYIGAKRFHEESLKLGNQSELVNYEGGWHGYFIFDMKLYNATVSRIEEYLKSRDFLN